MTHIVGGPPGLEDEVALEARAHARHKLLRQPRHLLVLLLRHQVLDGQQELGRYKKKE